MTSDKPPLAMTIGDPAGIGPELALSAWRARARGDAPFFVLAPPGLLRSLSKRLGVDTPIIETEFGRIASDFDRGLPVVPLENRVACEPGRPDAGAAGATIELITRAVELVRTGVARAVVTNPISKAVLYDAGFGFPGHTEFLGELASSWAPRLFRS